MIESQEDFCVSLVELIIGIVFATFLITNDMHKDEMVYIPDDENYMVDYE